MKATQARRASESFDFAILSALALCALLVHVVIGGRYGFHRDELQTLDDARHLAWGYVAYPPVTPFIGRVALELFGPSVAALRFFAALPQSIVIVLTGLMAREFGGKRQAQLIAASAAVPFALGGGALFQYVSFDGLWWVLIAYLMIRLLESDEPHWWLAVGLAIGLGIMTKYTIVFLIGGIVGGVLLTDERRHLKNRWLWFGVGLSLLVFLPNLIWQVRHDFISLDFLRHIHARDVRIGRTEGFLPDQLKIALFALPLWVAGLFYLLAAPEGRRYRLLGWMYVIPLVLFFIAKGRSYYLAPAYPMLFAAGSSWGERWVVSLKAGWARLVKAVMWAGLAANAAIVAALFLPIAPVNSAWWKVANEVNGDLREEIGWPELAETVAAIRDSLPADQRARAAILTGNYGEAGAIDLYGPAYGLPNAISGMNSYWLRGYGDPPPQTLIVVGFSREWTESVFQSCTLADHPRNRYGIENEETVEHPDMFVCQTLRKPWPEFWKEFRYYG